MMCVFYDITFIGIISLVIFCSSCISMCCVCKKEVVTYPDIRFCTKVARNGLLGNVVMYVKVYIRQTRC